MNPRQPSESITRASFLTRQSSLATQVPALTNGTHSCPELPVSLGWKQVLGSLHHPYIFEVTKYVDPVLLSATEYETVVP